MRIPLALQFESTIQRGEAKTIGQNAEKFGTGGSEIRSDGRPNLRGFADVVALATIDAG
jgi:hypothetical protein